MLGQVAKHVVRLIPDGLPLPILRGPLRGSWWIVGAAAGAGKGISTIVSPVESAELGFAEELAPRGGVAFDIGANVGLYSILLARLCRKVFAFEPVPRNLRYLKRTLEANRARNVTVIPWAVAESFELMAMTKGENCAVGSLDGAGAQPVVTISCDEFVRHYRVVPGLVKIDVEGAELQVLRGARYLLREHRPHVLLSTHGAELERDCVEYMREVGYGEPRRTSADPRTGGGHLVFTGKGPARAR